MASKLEKFQELNSSVTKIKIKKEDSETIGWELFEDDKLIGYGFNIKVPEQSLDVPLADEFDMYDVTGIVDLDFKLIELNIEQHDDYEGELWALDIVEDDYKNQYLNLTEDEIKLMPEGTIEAISESTISCKAVTESVRNKIGSIARYMK